ncbi:hypothetical protein FACS1894166_09740 [Bacilli bacterium]|nr:hypothetical protein FACS1894166_09740 [Bacilli bacterium]
MLINLKNVDSIELIEAAPAEGRNSGTSESIQIKFTNKDTFNFSGDEYHIDLLYRALNMAQTDKMFNTNIGLRTLSKQKTK